MNNMYRKNQLRQNKKKNRGSKINSIDPEETIAKEIDDPLFLLRYDD